MSRQTIWREGDRIRRTDGTGYSDFVSDEQIRENIARGHPDPLHDAFAAAVLAIRAFERLTACPDCAARLSDTEETDRG